MNARTRAMMAHPAGKALMSDDEAQARQDTEACTVGSLNWRTPETRDLSTGRHPRWMEIVVPTLTLIAVVTLLFVDVFILNTPAVTA